MSFDDREVSLAEESPALERRIDNLERTILQIQRERALAARMANLPEALVRISDGAQLPDRIVEVGRGLLQVNFVSLVAPAGAGGQFEPRGSGRAAGEDSHEARPEWHCEPRGSRRAAGEDSHEARPELIFEPLAAVGDGHQPILGRRWTASEDSALAAVLQGREPVAGLGERVQFNRALDRSLSLRSALHVPVLQDLGVVAVLTFGERETGRRFEPAEVAAARWLASWTGLLLGWSRDRQRIENLESLLRSHQAQLQHTEKLKALGQLVSGVAHELNNPLTAVLGRAALIEKADSLAEARRQAGKIKEAAGRAAKIAKGLSTFARNHPPERGPVNVNDLVRWATEFQEYQLAVDNIGIETDLEPELPPITGDHHELEQVLINLMLNAQHAMVAAHGSGTLRLSTRRVGEWVQLRVEDNGPGIPPELLPRIFEPFFTTKPVGEGTGLGLSIVQEIVTGHGGKVWVEPGSGSGTTVVVAIPPMRTAPAPAS